MLTTVPIDNIASCIFWLRGQKVMLSMHLAELYEVEPRALIQAVKRNRDRFPGDFAFQLSWEEVADLKTSLQQSSLRSHFVMLQPGRHPRYRPYAFTEQGVAMLSSVLKGRRAVLVNVAIMRAFVQLREMLSTHKELARRLEALERKYDGQFAVVFAAIRHLMKPVVPPRRQIGFK